MQRWASRLLNWAPAALAVVFVLVGILSQAEIRDSLNSHADFASAPVIAELMGDAPAGSTIMLGDYHWYEALWLLRGTGWLPFHHAVWQLIPFLIWIATALLAGGIVRRLSTRWAASVTVGLLICTGVGMRSALWSLDTHGPAALHVVLVGFALVVALQEPRWRRGLRGYGAAAVLGLITAVGVTDPLVAPFALGPLLLAGTAIWTRRGDAALLRLGVLVSVIAVVGAKLLDALARDASLFWTHKAFAFIPADGLLAHFSLIGGAVGQLVTFSAFGQPLTTATEVAMAGGLVALLTGAVVLHTGVRQAKRALWPERFVAVGTVPAGRPVPAEFAPGQPLHAGAPATEATIDDRDDAWAASLVFWLGVLVANILAWTFTTAALDVYGARYLISGWVGVCILMPLLAARLDLRWMAALAATIVCAAATYGFVKSPGPAAGSGFPSEAVASQVRTFAEANGVTRGYGGFWEAAPITWHTRFALKIYPIYPCQDGSGRNCQFYLHTISSWYAPQPGRSMLVTDANLPLQPTVDPAYGKPLRTKHFGSLTVSIYKTDIAPAIVQAGPPPAS